MSSWENKLSFLTEGLQLLNQIQRKWVYLEPIFARGALPSQQQRFRNIDEEFRRVMTSLESTKKVCGTPGGEREGRLEGLEPGREGQRGQRASRAPWPAAVSCGLCGAQRGSRG